MAQLTPEVLQSAVTLITQLRSGILDDGELSAVVKQLDRILPDPQYLDYTIDCVPELPAEEVVRRAFLYRPIQL